MECNLTLTWSLERHHHWPTAAALPDKQATKHLSQDLVGGLCLEEAGMDGNHGMAASSQQPEHRPLLAGDHAKGHLVALAVLGARWYGGQLDLLHVGHACDPGEAIGDL